MNIKKKKLNTGVLTIELLIAFAILLINVTGILLLTSGNQSTVVSAETNAEALSLAQQEIEKAKATAEGDFHVLSDYEGIEYPSGSLTYTKTLDIVPVADDDDTPWDESLFMNKVTSVIEWMGEKNQLKSVELTTIISNPEALGGGDTCSAVLLGDWENPIHEEYEFGAEILQGTSSPSNESSGYPITSIQTFNQKMYVTIDNSNGNNNGTFFVLDISNPPNMPEYITELDNNSGVKHGLNAVAIDGKNYAYVASAHDANFETCVNDDGNNLSCGQLQVIDLNSMSVVYTYKIPSVAGDDGSGVGKSIFYKDDVVYLGLTKVDAINGTNGHEFQVIDVSNPLDPSILFSEEIGEGVNSILVKDEYAYVTSPNNEELKIFDVSNPDSISQVGGFNGAGGGVPFYSHGKSIYKVGNKVYLGRTLSDPGEDEHYEFYVLDGSDSTDNNLPVLGLQSILNDDDHTSVNGIIVRHHLAFLITNREFQILDISDLSNIIEFTSPLDLPPGTGGGGGT